MVGDTIAVAANLRPSARHEVSARIEPWIDFAESAISGLLATTPLAGLVNPRDAAYLLVALYLGVEMLSHLSHDRAHAESLLTAAAIAAPFLTLFAPPAPS